MDLYSELLALELAELFDEFTLDEQFYITQAFRRLSEGQQIHVVKRLQRYAHDGLLVEAERLLRALPEGQCCLA